jgi:hypothetical protein
MKRRRQKHAFGREMRIARKDAVRDLGDHRRWRWIAVPESMAGDWEPLYDGGVWEFHPEYGRLVAYPKGIPGEEKVREERDGNEA